MRQLLCMAALALAVSTVTAAGAHEGCKKPAPRAKAAAAAKKAICAVCAVKGGHRGPEPVKATVKYKGKQYAFCNLGCKAEFIAKPARFASAVK